jgi:ribonuclease HI
MTSSYILLDQDAVMFNSYTQIFAKAPTNTNNVAEWTALGLALKTIVQGGTEPDVRIHIMGDSQLVIKQLTGEWACNAELLIKLRDRCKELLRGRTWSAAWIPREQNQVADLLGRELYKKTTGKEMPDRSK